MHKKQLKSCINIQQHYILEKKLCHYTFISPSTDCVITQLCPLVQVMPLHIYAP
jgi:hypothetical protein